jgi:hypothetical protein
VLHGDFDVNNYFTINILMTVKNFDDCDANDNDREYVDDGGEDQE